MKGFRGLLTILGTWATLLGDAFFTNISGTSPAQLKTAFIVSLPISLKLIWTDLRPRIMKLFT